MDRARFGKIGNLIKWLILYVYNFFYETVLPVFRDISTIRRRSWFIAKGICVLRVERFRESDRRYGSIQEARHRLINEAGKNDEIMTGRGGEREIGPPSFRVNRPVVRELVPRRNILLDTRGVDTWRGSAHGLKLNLYSMVCSSDSERILIFQSYESER